MGVVYNRCGGGNAELKLLWSGELSGLDLDLAGYDYIALEINHISPLFLATRQNNPTDVAGYAGYNSGSQLAVGEIYFSDTHVSITSFTTGSLQLALTKVYGVIGL